MAAPKDLKNNYDVIVIGGGLSGLLTALALSQQSKKVLLLEATAHVGGAHRALEDGSHDLSTEFRFLPASEDTKTALEFLRSLPGFESLESTLLESPPHTEKDHQLVPFIDFGDATPDFYQEISYFLNREEVRSSLHPRDWPQIAVKFFTGDLWTQSQASKLEIEDSQVVGVWVNAQKLVRASAVVMTAPLTQLPGMVTTPELVGKLKTDFSMQKFVTAIQVDVTHAPASAPALDENSTMPEMKSVSTPMLCVGFLSGAEPLTTIGRFEQAAEGSAPTSHWLSFVADDAAEDTEFVGECLRKMRRAMKRIHPELWQTGLKEKISIHSSYSYVGNLRSKDGMQSSLLRNLYLAPSGLRAPGNLIGTLLQVEKIVAAIGPNSKTSAKPQKSGSEPLEVPSEDSHREMDASPA